MQWVEQVNEHRRATIYLCSLFMLASLYQQAILQLDEFIVTIPYSFVRLSRLTKKHSDNKTTYL